MTLEDFFTLTEMKDGLTAPSRINELISVMQKEKDCVLKNVSEATRQWSTVATTIAATENRDCLDLFIQLDGLWFIERWLKDAQKFGIDTEECCVEESISALLQAVEKLHIDSEKSLSSGIWMNVKNLLSHKSFKVRDRAKALFGSWKMQEADGNALPENVENVEAVREDEIAVESGLPDEEKQIGAAKDEMAGPASSDALQLERLKDLKIQTSEETLDCPVTENGLKLEPVKDDLLIAKETTSVYTSNHLVAEESGVEGKSNFKGHVDGVKQMERMRSCSPEKLSARDVSSISSPLESRPLSLSADNANDPEPRIEGRLQNHIDATHEDPNQKPSSLGDVGIIVADEKRELDAIDSLNECISTRVFSTSYQDGECDSNNVLQDSSVSGSVLGKHENLDTPIHKTEARRAGEKIRKRAKDERRDIKLARKSKVTDVIGNTGSDFELDFSMVDAIEVARQVAIEVEREVEDRSREPSCSSSEEVSEGEIRQPDSPDSIDGKESQPIDGASKEDPTGLNEESPRDDEAVVTSENLQDVGSSQVTEGVQEQGGKSEKGLCDFDLNQEVSSEDMDHLVNSISTPISVVSASRAAAAPGSHPVSPLQFEGALGWKGSAATSAFRPASPRRNPEGDKNLSIGGSSNSSKQRQDRVDFDLNVAENENDNIADIMPRRKETVSYGAHSGESSVERSPRRSDRVNMLDLNRVSDDGDCQSDWGLERQRLFQHHRSGHHRSPSPSSASSSMQPSSVRNIIDLNDQPSFYNDSSDRQSYLGKSPFSQNLNSSGGLNSDDSAISIMGTRVEISRKNFIPLSNGRISEPALDLNLARNGGGGVLGLGSTVPYSHSHALGYNGLTVGPPMSFSSAIYGSGGPVPYMVDSRGTPVVHQFVGSASTVPSSFSQPPFLMGLTGTFSGSDGAGPSRPIMDLNSGLMFEGGSTRMESGVLRQLFSPGPQGRPIDEPQHLRVNLQQSSSSPSVVGGKRKEPDGGLEPYIFNYKYQQAPWK